MKLLLILLVLHEVIGGWETWEPWDSCHNGYKKRQRGFISHYQTQNTRCFVSNTCNQDSDCDTANCFYCLSNGKCGKYDSEYCDKDGVVCGQGDGDCDKTCPSGLTCGRNNFLQYHPRLSHCSGTSSAEVCIQGVTSCWSQWTAWQTGSCSKTCGGGQQIQTFKRTCTCHSHLCLGQSHQTKSTYQSCNINPCSGFDYCNPNPCRRSYHKCKPVSDGLCTCTYRNYAYYRFCN